MTQICQTLTKLHIKVLGVLIGLAAVSSILLHSGCGMTSRPNIPTPTPTPTPTPDTTPPTVKSFTPAAGAINVRVDSNVTVTFSEAMAPATVNGTTIELRDQSSALVPATVSYDAGSFTATLHPTALLSGEVMYTARIKGGAADPRVKDLAGNALAIDVTWSFKTAPLQVLSVTPKDGADAIPAGVAPRAVFSRPLDPATVNSSTVLLKDGDSNQVPFEIRYSSSAFTVAIVPHGLLQPLQTYTVTFEGGPNEPHITDSTGTPLPSDSTWTFTIAAAPPQTTIFAPTATPAIPVFNDTEPDGVELGLKFRSDTDGIITGVRFYKGGPQNGGMHVGHLWTITGTPLRGVAFSGESESGWQQTIFSTPAPITAGETYVVSYFAPQKNYSITPGQFNSMGVDNGPLHALSSAETGGDPTGNGVFRYNPNPSPIAAVFPDQSFNSTNYWVDVVFVNPTLEPPQVLRTTPNPGALLVSTTGQFPDPFSVTFSESLDPATVNTTTISLTDTAGAAVPVNVSYTPGSLTVTITPQQGLQPGQAYTVTLKGGAAAPRITDASGTPLASDFTWSITTK